MPHLHQGPFLFTHQEPWHPENLILPRLRLPKMPGFMQPGLPRLEQQVMRPAESVQLYEMHQPSFTMTQTQVAWPETGQPLHLDIDISKYLPQECLEWPASLPMHDSNNNIMYGGDVDLCIEIDVVPPQQCARVEPFAAPELWLSNADARVVAPQHCARVEPVAAAPEFWLSNTDLVQEDRASIGGFNPSSTSLQALDRVPCGPPGEVAETPIGLRPIEAPKWAPSSDLSCSSTRFLDASLAQGSTEASVDTYRPEPQAWSQLRGLLSSSRAQLRVPAPVTPTRLDVDILVPGYEFCSVEVN